MSKTNKPCKGKWITTLIEQLAHTMVSMWEEWDWNPVKEPNTLHHSISVFLNQCAVQSF